MIRPGGCISEDNAPDAELGQGVLDAEHFGPSSHVAAYRIDAFDVNLENTRRATRV